MAASTRSSTKPMARPTRVMAKQVTAVSAISGPTAASSARGSADAVVVAARREPVTSLVGLQEKVGRREGDGHRQYWGSLSVFDGIDGKFD